jgi:hypothetical protein
MTLLKFLQEAKTPEEQSYIIDRLLELDLLCATKMLRLCKTKEEVNMVRNSFLGKDSFIRNLEKWLWRK